ncbi:MAG: hypothetical protein AAF993_11100 [Pseudomonadota bacterium]
MPHKPDQVRKSIAEERQAARRIGWVRLVRTVLLGTVALGAGIYWGAQQFGIDRELVLAFLSGSLLFVGGLVIAGLLGAVILLLVKRLLDKKAS